MNWIERCIQDNCYFQIGQLGHWTSSFLTRLLRSLIVCGCFIFMEIGLVAGMTLGGLGILQRIHPFP